MLTWDDFQKVEIRVGTILEVRDFPEAKQPAYQVWVDFGALGVKKTSAQITQLYSQTDLVGQQVMAVTNFPPKQIANFMSECLILGLVSDDKACVLLQPERAVTNGQRVS